MIFYFDSSVVVRIILGEPNTLADWDGLPVLIASRLVRLESLRTLDRYRLLGELSEKELIECRRRCSQIFKHMTFLPISERVCQRAEASFPSIIKSLDSIHLATSLLWRETRGEDIVFATHDLHLSRAASLQGLEVIGV